MDAMESGAKQTLGYDEASREAGLEGLWKLPLMLWKVEQNRHLARMAGLEAGSRLWKLVLSESAKQTLG